MCFYLGENKLILFIVDMMKRTNILNELKKVNPVITEETNFKTILGIISSESNSNNKFNFDKLDKNKIFDLESIKKICINFRLRFLDHKYFKNSLPKEAFLEISKLESP